MWWSRIVLLKLLMFSYIASVNAQDLFSRASTEHYAWHLKFNEKYADAAEEFKRLTVLDSASELFRLEMLRMYRKAHLPNKAIEYVHREKWLQKFQSIPMYQAYISTLFDAKQYVSADSALQILPLPPKQKNKFIVYSMLLQNKFEEANAFIDSTGFENYSIDIQSIYYAIAEKRSRNKALAATLSAIVPGLGKAYTGEYVDGLVSFVTVAGFTVLTYSAATRLGPAISYVQTAVLGSMAAGFYGGNIYGAIQSAKRYNKRKNDEIRKMAALAVYFDNDLR